ncbi:MAG TPA: hypothetical protein VKV69_04195 [Actinomycetota bacterium]|nr:hypothetical protein [Actinomycetota bacterium]
MIVFVLGAGLVTVFVKNDTTMNAPTALGPAPSSSVAVTVQPTTTVEGTQKLAARKNGQKKSADELMPIPHLPASGVGGHPIGFVLVAIGAAIALWVRRAART